MNQSRRSFIKAALAAAILPKAELLNAVPTVAKPEVFRAVVVDLPPIVFDSGYVRIDLNGCEYKLPVQMSLQ